jgi:hypothetical protein
VRPNELASVVVAASEVRIARTARYARLSMSEIPFFINSTCAVCSSLYPLENCMRAKIPRYPKHSQQNGNSFLLHLPLRGLSDIANPVSHRARSSMHLSLSPIAACVAVACPLFAHRFPDISARARLRGGNSYSSSELSARNGIPIKPRLTDRLYTEALGGAGSGEACWIAVTSDRCHA